MNSTLGQLNWKDLIKGLAVAVIMAVITTVYDLLNSGANFDYKKIGLVAFGAGIAYLIKNFGSDQKGNLLGVK